VVVTLLFPSAIKVEFSPFVKRLVFLARLAEGHDDIAVDFARHLSQLFVQTGVQRIQVEGARVVVKHIALLVVQIDVAVV